MTSRSEQERNDREQRRYEEHCRDKELSLKENEKMLREEQAKLEAQKKREYEEERAEQLRQMNAIVQERHERENACLIQQARETGYSPPSPTYTWDEAEWLQKRGHGD